MLGKLIRHEFRATWKVLLLMDAVLLCVGIFGFFVLSTVANLNKRNNDDYIGVIVTSYFLWFVLYMLAIFAANLGTLIFLTIRYYRNLYSAEGYLTFTLPVETKDLLHAKMINGYIWMFAGTLLTAFSVFLMVMGLMSGVDPYERAQILSELSEIAVSLSPGMYVMFSLLGLIGPLQILMTVYFCITVGQLWQKHRIAGAVLCYVGLTFVSRTLHTFTTIGRFLTRFNQIEDAFEQYYLGTLGYSLGFAVIFCVVSYLVIRWINANKVNLA